MRREEGRGWLVVPVRGVAHDMHNEAPLRSHIPVVAHLNFSPSGHIMPVGTGRRARRVCAVLWASELSPRVLGGVGGGVTVVVTSSRMIVASGSRMLWIVARGPCTLVAPGVCVHTRLHEPGAPVAPVFCTVVARF